MYLEEGGSECDTVVFPHAQKQQKMRKQKVEVRSRFSFGGLNTPVLLQRGRRTSTQS